MGSSDPHAFDNLDDLLNADVNFDLSSLAVDSDGKPAGNGTSGGSAPASQTEVLAWLATHPLGLEPLFSVDQAALINAYHQQQHMLLQLQLQQQQAHLQSLQQFARPPVPQMGPFGGSQPVASLSMPNLAARPTGSTPSRPQQMSMARAGVPGFPGVTQVGPGAPPPAQQQQLFFIPNANVGGLPIGSTFPNFHPQVTPGMAIPTSKSSVSGDPSASPAIMSVHSTEDNLSVGSPQSKGADMDEEMVMAKRSAHSVAEAKRRSNIKNGFHELQQIVPNCKKGESQGRFSKALILKKAVEYIACLVRDRTSLLSEVTKLREEVVRLRRIIDEYERLGGPGEVEARAKLFAVMAREHETSPEVLSNTENIKFFVFVSVVDRLWESFNAMVSLEDPETFSKTLMAWFERFCGPDALRHIFLTSLQSLGSSLFTDESQEKIRRWGGALSAYKELMVTSLDQSRIPGARALGQTIDTAAGYLGAPESLKQVTAAPSAPSPPQSVKVEQQMS